MPLDVAVLPVARASELAPDEPDVSWLVQGLWAAHGVGFVGGLRFRRQ